MQKIVVKGDIAALLVSGFTACWERDGNVVGALEPLTGPTIAVDRAALKGYDLRLPAPEYPATYTGPKTVATDFRSVIA